MLCRAPAKSEVDECDRKVRIGILGGTFDPVHYSHLALAKSAVKELRLNCLFFIPAKKSPLKSNCLQTNPEHRVFMLKLALKKMPKCKISTIEIHRSGHSYTIRTIRAFRKKFPHDELFFVMGSDSLKSFTRWKNWEEILGLCTLIVGRRTGIKMKPFTGMKELINKTIWLKSRIPKISSTQVRSALRKGQSVSEKCPASVLNYINKHHFYSFA